MMCVVPRWRGPDVQLKEMTERGWIEDTTHVTVPNRGMGKSHHCRIANRTYKSATQGTMIVAMQPGYIHLRCVSQELTIISTASASR